MMAFWGLKMSSRVRGPAAGNESLDSIAKTIRCLFLWGIAQLSRDMLHNGVSHRCACVKLSTKGRVSHHPWGVANLPEKASRDMRSRSDSIAISCGMGPLSAAFGKNFLPELCGEVHPETVPLQAVCCALRST